MTVQFEDIDHWLTIAEVVVFRSLTTSKVLKLSVRVAGVYKTSPRIVAGVTRTRLEVRGPGGASGAGRGSL